MGKKFKNCTCHECEVVLEIKVSSTSGGESGQKFLPQICPFCGDSLDIQTEAPLLKDFDDYDDFNDDKYYSDDDEIDDE